MTHLSPFPCEHNLSLNRSSKIKSLLTLSCGGIRLPTLNGPLYNKMSPYHRVLSPANSREKPITISPEGEKRKETLVIL